MFFTAKFLVFFRMRHMELLIRRYVRRTKERIKKWRSYIDKNIIYKIITKPSELDNQILPCALGDGYADHWVPLQRWRPHLRRGWSHVRRAQVRPQRLKDVENWRNTASCQRGGRKMTRQVWFVVYRPVRWTAWPDRSCSAVSVWQFQLLLQPVYC